MPSPDARTSDPPGPQDATLDAFLNRPLTDRIREFKYRFAQAAVFGLPVIALQYLGPRLGGGESGRWVGLFQALLAGWVVYVASGMLFEGLIHGFRGRFTPDLVVILAVIGLYLAGFVAWLAMLAGRPWFPPVLHWAVIVILGWAGFRWAQLRRRCRSRGPCSPPARRG